MVLNTRSSDWVDGRGGKGRLMRAPPSASSLPSPLLCPCLSTFTPFGCGGQRQGGQGGGEGRKLKGNPRHPPHRGEAQRSHIAGAPAWPQSKWSASTCPRNVKRYAGAWFSPRILWLNKVHYPVSPEWRYGVMEFRRHISGRGLCSPRLWRSTMIPSERLLCNRSDGS